MKEACQLTSEGPASWRFSGDAYFGRATWVRTVEHHRQIDSTNSYALRLIRSRGGELAGQVPLVVLADEQTAGRGREGRTWWTGPGSIALSLVVRLGALPIPGVGVVDLRFGRAQLGLTVAVALATALAELEPKQLRLAEGAVRGFSACCGGERLGGDLPAEGEADRPAVELGIKWPNDVFLGGKKLAGVLVELAEPDWAVIGLGVNTNCLLTEAPPEVRRRATSLREATGRIWDNRLVVAGWLDKLASLWREMIEAPEAAVRLANQLCLGIGQDFCVKSGSSLVRGICRGIAPDGGLLLEGQDGKVVTVYSGHVLD